MTWTMKERNAQRRLQDSFLALLSVRQWEVNYGADEPIAGPSTPTIRHLRDTLCFAHREVLNRTLEEIE